MQAQLYGFSPLELYLMGLATPQEVNPIQSYDFSGIAQTPITIESVIAANGPRLPAYDGAVKTIRVPMVIVVPQNENVDDATLTNFAQLIERWKTRFASETGGRALIASSLSSFGSGAGWNLVGNSINAPLNVAATFADSTKVTSVWKWISNMNRWAFYSPKESDGGQAYANSKGYEFLSTISAGEGFWVDAMAPFTALLPVGTAVIDASFQGLSSGWHLISTGDNRTPAAFNTDVAATTLWTWDNAQSKWYFYAPSLEAQGGTALSDYITAHGYLDFTSAGKTLGPGVGFWVNKP